MIYLSTKSKVKPKLKSKAERAEYAAWCSKYGIDPEKKRTKKPKFWEVEVIKNDNLLRLEFEVTTQQDHAGVNLELGLLGYEVHFTFYDNRHWNSEEGRWMVYTEENGYH